MLQNARFLENVILQNQKYRLEINYYIYSFYIKINN